MSRRVEVDSKLAMVTVFNNRAQLFHSAEVDLSPQAPGEEVVLVFTKGQWSEANRSTLQVNIKEGAQAIILRSVQFKTVTSIVDVRPQKQALRDLIDTLVKEQRAVKDEVTVNGRILASYRSVLDKVNSTQRSQGDAKYSEAVSAYVLDVSAQERMTNFVQTNIRELIKKARDIETKLEDVERRLSSARVELSACGGDEKRTSTDVAEVQIVLNAPTKLKLLLSYLVNNASWTPSYDLRVDSKQKSMTVHYNAVVRQSTLTDWEKVQLELSTASPHVGGDPPKLTKWNISLRPPSLPFSRGPFGGGCPPKPQMMMQQMMPCSAASNMIAAPPPPPAPVVSRPAVAEAASVTTSSTSTTFSIVGRQTVKADNTDVKVTIIQSDLPVHLRYSAVPKLDEHTYLKAKAINTTGCILLPGTVNTFADNQFIGKSAMDSTAPDEEFWTFLGVDDDVCCTRKLAHRKFADKSGFLGAKKTRVEYKYVFTVKNGKRTAEEVVVWDQFPLAEDKKIVVTVTCPTKDMSGVKYETNQLNAIEWFWDLKPNSSQSFEYTFQVDYPTEEQLTGLDKQ